MTRAVIWELDGVVADTAEAHFRGWVTALAEWEIPLTREMFSSLFGLRNDEILSTVLGRPAEPREQGTILGRKEHFFGIEVGLLIQPSPGISSLLAELAAAGWLQGLVSTMPQATMDLIVDRLGIRDYFQAFVSGEAFPHPRPDATYLLHAAERLRAAPERCITVDRTAAGVEAAHRAGMRCLAIADTRSRHDLLSADSLVDDMSAVTIDTFNQWFQDHG